MGANILRAFRNFNVESRAHQLIGKDKPSPAPRHPGVTEAIQTTSSAHSDIQDKMYRKDEQLLSRLRDVYVDSTDPPPKVPTGVPLPKEEDWRPPRQGLTNAALGITMDNIPKGKISVVEALTILNSYKQSPRTWTAEKLAAEYSLDTADTKAMLEYFAPFDIKIIESNDKEKIADN